MGYGFSAAEIAYLGSVPGTAALAEVAEYELSAASQVRDAASVRRRHGDRAPALIETVRLRRRAAAKLSGARDWLLTDDALQQATPTLVARHRARRLAGRDVHDVTCSIGAELVELARHCPRVVGGDLDPLRLAMAQHNLTRPVPDAAAAGQRATVLLARADALAPCTSGTVVVADPARRSGGKRTHDPRALQPPLPDLLSVYSGRDLAVKCAPGLDFDRLDWDGEIEVISLDGAVREACLWSAGLREPGVTRRATVLGTAGTATTLTDADPGEIPEREPGSGSSTRTARWCGPDWFATTRPAMVCGSWIRGSPISPATVSPRACGASGSSVPVTSGRRRCGPNSAASIAVGSRSSCAEWRSIPMRCADG